MSKITQQLGLIAKDLHSSTKQQDKTQESQSGKSFIDHLKDGVEQVNQSQVVADKMASSVAVGKTENLHETMVALSQAELGFNLVVQVRNKALEAYQEIMRMQV